MVIGGGRFLMSELPLYGGFVEGDQLFLICLARNGPNLIDVNQVGTIVGIWALRAPNHCAGR